MGRPHDGTDGSDGRDGTDLREFVRSRYSDLLRTAYLLTGGTAAAEDLVQTALLRAMRHWDRIEDPMAYLRTSMAHLRISLWRRVLTREVLSGVPLDRQAGGPDGAEQVAERDLLLRALAKLPVRMRTVLVLRYWEDLSIEETATVLGCGTGSVKSQASRGLERLRQVLADQDTPGETGTAALPRLAPVTRRNA